MDSEFTIALHKALDLKPDLVLRVLNGWVKKLTDNKYYFNFLDFSFSIDNIGVRLGYHGVIYDPAVRVNEEWITVTMWANNSLSLIREILSYKDHDLSKLSEEEFTKFMYCLLSIIPVDVVVDEEESYCPSGEDNRYTSFAVNYCSNFISEIYDKMHLNDEVVFMVTHTQSSGKRITFSKVFPIKKIFNLIS